MSCCHEPSLTNQIAWVDWRNFDATKHFLKSAKFINGYIRNHCLFFFFRKQLENYIPQSVIQLGKTPKDKKRSVSESLLSIDLGTQTQKEDKGEFWRPCAGHQAAVGIYPSKRNLLDFDHSRLKHLMWISRLISIFGFDILRWTLADGGQAMTVHQSTCLVWSPANQIHSC